MKIINGKFYEVCCVCGEIIRLDKPIIGGLHFCLSDDEEQLCKNQKQFRDWQTGKIKKSVKLLYN